MKNIYKNIYPGTCSVCRSPVETGKGEYDKPTRKVKCAKCAGIREDAKPRISVKHVGNSVSFAPTTFLGGDLFNKYREAVTGSRYEPLDRTNIAPVAKALAMVNALTAAGFIVDIPPALASTLQATRAEQLALVATANDRAVETDRKLKERGLILFPFQKVGIKWLASRVGALLADEMGLGKTIQVVVAMPEKAPAVVVCAAVAKGVWAREIARWRPDLTPVVLDGRGSFRWPQAGEVVITNFDVLPAPPPPPGNPGAILPPWDVEPLDGTVLVGDEVHAIKSSRSKRTMSFRAISERVRAKRGRVWLVTGTPLLNKPPELWCILQSADIAREAYGSWNGFMGDFRGEPGEWGGVEWGEPTDAASEKLRRVCLRRMRQDVLPELPAKQWQKVPVDLEAKYKKAIDKAAKYVLDLLPTAWDRLLSDDDLFEPKEKPKPDDVQVARDIITNSSHTNFEAISGGRKLLATAKIPAMLEFVEDFEEQGEPLVVFSAHRAPIDLLADREGWAVITGDTPNEERTKIEDAFQAGKLKGVAGTIRAAGVAITLTHAHHLLFVDREYVPGLNDQAEDRVCRIGQSRGVIIHDLVANHPLDKILYEILAKKELIIEKSVDAASVKEDRAPDILPDLDFEALAKAAEEEAKASEAAEREAIARREKVEAEKRAYEEERARAMLEGRVVAAEFLAEGRRAPQNPREQWALRALITLNRLDPDRASARNDVGFNGADSGYGHRLGGRLFDGLTDKEWQVAIALCTKYWRHEVLAAGRAPSREGLGRSCGHLLECVFSGLVEAVMVGRVSSRFRRTAT
jgi:SWI/SNF-related matrix-associated actin-dependent regulator 1 of chromatin subfamily A